jgi:hypothetical protein
MKIGENSPTPAKQTHFAGSGDRSGRETIPDQIPQNPARLFSGRGVSDPPPLPGILRLHDWDKGLRAKTLLRMQRVIGNAAVQSWILANGKDTASLATAAVTGTVQRQPNSQPQTPAVSQQPPQAGQDEEQIRTAARDGLPIWADTFANLWYTANTGALAATAEPEDPDFVSATGAHAKLAFGIALAGNLVWAATCLTPAGPAAVAMSFGGAAVGSGVIPIVAGGEPKSSQPSFKPIVAGALAKGRDQIAQASRNAVKAVADECATAKISDIEEQKKRLWAKVYSTAYNEAAPIESAAAAKLTAGAQSFVAAWQAHKKDPAVDKEGNRRMEERIRREGYPWSVKLRWLIEPSGPGGPIDEYRLGIYNEEKMKYAVESFRPTLTF